MHPTTTVRTEEDYTAARADYDAMLPGEAGRLEKRSALLAYLLHEADSALARNHADDAEQPFKQALSLYAPVDLRDGSAAKEKDATAVVATSRAYEVGFRKRGAHEQVLTALAARITLSPNDESPKKRYGEIIVWLEQGGGDEDGPDGATRVIDDLEAVARVFPSPFVVEELERRYHEVRLPAPARSAHQSMRALRELMNEEQRASRAYEIARLYLRVSEITRAASEMAAMRTGGKLRGDETGFAQLVEKAAARDAVATDWVALAMSIIRQSRERNGDDRDVALQVCRDAEVRFPKAIEPGLCAGQLALSMEQLGTAQRAFEAVRAIDPSRREAWEALAHIYESRLFQVVTEEDLDVSGLPAALAKVEAFHAEATKRFPTQPLDPGVAGAVFQVGRGYYNAGHIPEAEKYLQRSIDLQPNRDALELLAQIRLKRNDPQRAAVLVERAINLGTGAKEEQLYRRAKLRRLLADAVEAAGDTKAAAQTRRGAVEDWDVLLDLGLQQKEFAAEALLERGKLLYQLGDREEGLHSLARAIDTLPDHGSSYADVIAFLIPRAELADALDAYHRALGRSEVTDYLKVYCSLWIVDLAHRAGQPEDPLALAYLRSADGGKWFDDLARWSTGRESEAELVKRADTQARKAECAFYRSMKALRDGHTDEAQRLWKEVIATDMMAFFEYDMASMYLRGGAPSTPHIVKMTAAKPSVKPQPVVPAQAPPDGSI
ncbi:MAG: hypothetical protein ABI321_17230 [Polyangia bacterium]